MKKTNKIIEETEHLEVEALINKTALVTSNRGVSGLYNTNTKTFIGELDEYRNYYSKDNNVIWQIKECASGKKLIRIYDTLKEKMIVDGWEYIANDDFIITRSPDRKYHLFDSQCFRDNNNLLNKGVDDIKSFAKMDGVYYFLISENGKKGLYASNGAEAHLTSIEYDDIKNQNGFIIFTKNNKKQFKNIENYYVSKWYDDVKFDKDGHSIIYGKNKSSISVYSIQANKVIFNIDCDNMSCIYSTIYLIKRGNKYGLIECEDYSMDNPKVRVLVEPIYDEITSEPKTTAFYLKNEGKVGIYDYMIDKVIEPQYDKIEYLYHDFFAFYNGELCDIGKINEEPLVKDCSIEELKVKGVLENNAEMIYKKDGKYGLINFRKEQNIYGYDKITECVYDYYVFEKSGKKSLWSNGEFILPKDYDDIKIMHSYMYNLNCMALRTDDKYKLAYIDDNREKIIISEENYFDITFYEDIFILKDSEFSYIFNYQLTCIKTCVPDAVVTEIKTDNKKKNLYCINGVYYDFINGTLQEALVESRKRFVTTFETDLEVFELTTSDEEIYKKFNEDMDILGDVLAEEYLSHSETVKENYPKLTLKRLKKPQN